MSNCWTFKFSKQAFEDYQEFAKHDIRIVKKINQLIENMLIDPEKGLGKPEALKENLSGYWSRRITDRHRLVYTMKDNVIYIASCRFHYKK